MDRDRYSLLSEIVAEVIELDAEERNRFLDARCGSDRLLRQEVEELLSFQDDGDSTDFLAERGIASARDALEGIASEEVDEASWLPEKIGGYRVQRRIGAGGMGVVYEAVQKSPHRLVAIKLMHPMHSTPDRIRRFRSETELLGRLIHQNIAQIHEAGFYDIGSGPQPFFAMELVDGVDIRSYCQREGLTIHQRLELLAQVCDGVQHAHDQGVIHRDIKADNVLVDERGLPKILDFGIARASASTTLLSTVLTDEGQLVGTLAYMAPEQLEASSDNATIQVDVYALGVLGFEILTGRLPFEITDLSITAAISLLANNDPPKAASINPELRGDVETILGKALESDPARRYASAASLAADIHRHFDNIPIQARPATRAYRLLKFTRRHRGLTVGAVSTFVTLVIGLIVSLLLARQEREQRIRADENALEMRRSEARVVSGLMESANNLLERRDYWAASKQHRLVPESARGWSWHFLARSLPHLIDVESDLKHFDEIPKEKRRPILRFLDDDHIYGLDPSQGFVMTLSLEPPHEKRTLFADLGLEVLGEATPTGFVLGWREGETLLLDLNHGLLKRSWSSELTRDLGNVSDDGRVAVIQVSEGRAEVWVEGEFELGIDCKGAKANVAPPHCRVAPDGQTVFVNDLSALRRIDLDSGTERTYLPHEGFDRILGYGLDSGWVAHQWEEPGTKFASSRLQSGPEAVLDEGTISIAGYSELSAFRVPRHGKFIVVSTRRTLIRDSMAAAPIRLTPFQNKSGWLQPSSATRNITEVSPTGKRLMNLTHEGLPWLMDADPEFLDGAGDRVLVAELGGKPSSRWGQDLAVSHDGSLIASVAPHDPMIRIWDAHDLELLAFFERPLDRGSKDSLLAFARNDDRLVFTTPLSGHEGAGVVEWDLLLGTRTRHWVDEPVKDANHFPLLDRLIDCLQPQPGERLNSRVQMLDETALVVDRTFEDYMTWIADPTEEKKGKRWSRVKEPQRKEKAATCALSIHPLNHVVAVVTEDQISAVANSSSSGTLTILDATDGAVIRELSLDRQPLTTAYSPDGSRLAIGTSTGHILIFETEFYTRELEFKAHGQRVHSLVWMPDGERLVTSSRDLTLRIWDARSHSIRRAEVNRWKSLRADMAARTDLESAVENLEGLERAAARAELVHRLNRLARADQQVGGG